MNIYKHQVLWLVTLCHTKQSLVKEWVGRRGLQLAALWPLIYIFTFIWNTICLHASKFFFQQWVKTNPKIKQCSSVAGKEKSLLVLPLSFVYLVMCKAFYWIDIVHIVRTTNWQGLQKQICPLFCMYNVFT